MTPTILILIILIKIEKLNTCNIKQLRSYIIKRFPKFFFNHHPQKPQPSSYLPILLYSSLIILASISSFSYVTSS